MLVKICDSEALRSSQTAEALNNFLHLWEAMFPVERYKLLHARIRKVSIFEREVRICFAASGIVKLFREAGLELENDDWSVDCCLAIPCRLRRNGGKLEIAVKGKAEAPEMPLQKALIQARQYVVRLTGGEFKNIQELAKSLNLDRSYVMRTLQLANLAPGHRRTDHRRQAARRPFTGQAPWRHPGILGGAEVAVRIFIRMAGGRFCEPPGGLSLISRRLNHTGNSGKVREIEEPGGFGGGLRLQVRPVCFGWNPQKSLP